jgi:hypothetical protein
MEFVYLLWVSHNNAQRLLKEGLDLTGVWWAVFFDDCFALFSNRWADFQNYNRSRSERFKLPTGKLRKAERGLEILNVVNVEWLQVKGLFLPSTFVYNRLCVGIQEIIVAQS